MKPKPIKFPKLARPDDHSFPSDYELRLLHAQRLLEANPTMFDHASAAIARLNNTTTLDK